MRSWLIYALKSGWQPVLYLLDTIKITTILERNYLRHLKRPCPVAVMLITSYDTQSSFIICRPPRKPAGCSVSLPFMPQEVLPWLTVRFFRGVLAASLCTWRNVISVDGFQVSCMIGHNLGVQLSLLTIYCGLYYFGCVCETKFCF